MIGFAGAITEDEAKTLGALLVRSLPEGPRVDDAAARADAPRGPRLVFVDKPERTQTQILIGTLGTHAARRRPLAARRRHGRLRRHVHLAHDARDPQQARLVLRDERAPLDRAQAPRVHDGRVPGRRATARRASRSSSSCSRTSSSGGITPRELAFIKNYLVRSHAFEIDTAPKRLGQALEAELLDLPADYHTGYLDHVRAVTLESANAAVRERLTPKDLVVIVVGTASEILDEVTTAIPGLDRAQGHPVRPGLRAERGVATVFVSGTLPGDGVARSARRTTSCRHEDGVRSAAFEACRADVEAVVALLTDRIDAAFLERSPRLRIVANVAVGVDNVDLAACKARGVIVTNTPDVLTEATADLAFGLLLAAARRIAEGDRLVRAGGFTGWTPTFMLGTRVHGATLGIVGLGRIGQAVARRARGFRCVYSTRSGPDSTKRRSAPRAHLRRARRARRPRRLRVDPLPAHRRRRRTCSTPSASPA